MRRILFLLFYINQCIPSEEKSLLLECITKSVTEYSKKIKGSAVYINNFSKIEKDLPQILHEYIKNNKECLVYDTFHNQTVDYENILEEIQNDNKKYGVNHQKNIKEYLDKNICTLSDYIVFVYNSLNESEKNLFNKENFILIIKDRELISKLQRNNYTIFLSFRAIKSFQKETNKKETNNSNNKTKKSQKNNKDKDNSILRWTNFFLSVKIILLCFTLYKINKHYSNNKKA